MARHRMTQQRTDHKIIGRGSGSHFQHCLWSHSEEHRDYRRDCRQPAGMETTDEGQPFAVAELQAVGAMIDKLPFGGTAWTVSAEHEAFPEMIDITPPRCQEPWWLIWKALDGRIMVDVQRHHDEMGNCDKMECDEYGRMAEAIEAVRYELVWCRRPGRAR
jgi:hypothetical protein